MKMKLSSDWLRIAGMGLMLGLSLVLDAYAERAEEERERRALEFREWLETPEGLEWQAEQHAQWMAAEGHIYADYPDDLDDEDLPIFEQTPPVVERPPCPCAARRAAPAPDGPCPCAARRAAREAARRVATDDADVRELTAAPLAPEDMTE
ncbi:hypothetical protein V3W47_18975 [Deinococcus sp. YIM 134068]|uniref:hypothetical protein n=1 Tax=Deinococcus lichenicola TaxID=3118910 RepID=UPI002F95F6B1